MFAFRKMVVSLLAVTMLLSLMPMVSTAQGPEEEWEKIFLRLDWDGNEEGTEGKPYNTETEAIRYASSRPNGARIWRWNETESKYERTDQYVPHVDIPRVGAPLALQVLWGLALVLALALVITGWALRKKSRSSAESD